MDSPKLETAKVHKTGRSQATVCPPRQRSTKYDAAPLVEPATLYSHGQKGLALVLRKLVFLKGQPNSSGHLSLFGLYLYGQTVFLTMEYYSTSELCHQPSNTW